ncbi:MAG: Rho termination factor N-terminal domain-containing protein [Candidatus Krumholzibacteriia bacterium]
MPHERRFAIAAALAASRIIPRGTPVLGSLTRSSLMTFATAAAVTYAFAGLARSNGGRPAPVAAAPARAYEDWTRDELYRRAQELELEGRSRLNKEELIEALRQHDG